MMVQDINKLLELHEYHKIIKATKEMEKASHNLEKVAEPEDL